MRGLPPGQDVHNLSQGEKPVTCHTDISTGFSYQSQQEEKLGNLGHLKLKSLVELNKTLCCISEEEEPDNLSINQQGKYCIALFIFYTLQVGPSRSIFDLISFSVRKLPGVCLCTRGWRDNSDGSLT